MNELRMVLLGLLVAALPLTATAEESECDVNEEACEHRCLNPLEESGENEQIDGCLQRCEARANECRASVTE